MSIVVNNVTKIYGNQKALDSVSFQVNPGEIVGFLGPNGAGKSTMMKIISGYLPQTEGEVLVCNEDVAKDELKTKRFIGYLPENNPLYTEMYVKEYLEFSGGMYGIDNLKSRVDEIVALVGLGKEQHKKIGALSKGYRQRVGLGQAFLHDPAVLILDEPTTGLDPNQIQEIRQLIQANGKDKTVMLSTHIMQEVEAICDRVIIINEGIIVADRTIGELKKSGSATSTLRIEFKESEELVDFEKAFSDKGLKMVAKNRFELSGTDLIPLKKKVMQFAVENNLEITQLTEENKNLEDVFRDLTTSQKA